MDTDVDYPPHACEPVRPIELPYQPSVPKRKRSIADENTSLRLPEPRNNPFIQPQALHERVQLTKLVEIWHQAWDTLTQDETTKLEDGAASDSDISLQIRALVDSPYWDQVIETNHGASARIVNMVLEGNQIRQSHQPLEPQEFRLLYQYPSEPPAPLSYHLFNRTLPERSDQIEYTAFSYCWGPRLQKHKVIFINGSPFIISETLFDLLDQSRISKSAYFWIDALCIRQDEDDAADKNAQIPLMGSIYRKATWVDIWLGRDSDGVGVALDQLYDQGPQALLDPDCAEKIYSILQRAWFGRVWIIQELLLAQPDAPVLILGPFEIEWELFAEAVLQFEALCTQHECLSVKIDGMGQYHRYGSWATLKSRIRSSQAFTLITHRKHYLKDQIKINSTTDAESRILRAEMCAKYLHVVGSGKATDLRDKVYGILGIVPYALLPDFSIDYRKSIARVYADMTISLMSISPKMPYLTLLYTYPVLSASTHLGKDVPSWTLDFSGAEIDRANATLFDKDPWLRTHTPSVDATVPFDLTARALELPVDASPIDTIIQVIDTPSAMQLQTALDIFSQSAGLLHEEVVDSFGKCARFLSAAQAIYDQSWDQLMSDYSWERSQLWQIMNPETFRKSYKFDAGEWSDRFEALFRGRDTFSSQDPYAVQLMELAAESRPGSREPTPDVHMSGVWDDSVLQFSWYLYVQPIVYNLCQLLRRFSRRKCSFFVTKHGLGGLGMPGAKVGDAVTILFRKTPGCIEVPFIIRDRADGCFSMVSVAHVADDWKNLAQARGTFEPQNITLR